MYNITLLFCSLLLNSCSITTETNTILEIDFQDFFQEDLVSLSINDCDVFHKLKLTSDEIIGLTDVSVKVIKISSEKAIIKYDKDYVDCTLKKKESIKIYTTLNGKDSLFRIDLIRGKHIGFGKKIDEIYMIQSEYPFEYE